MVAWEKHAMSGSRGWLVPAPYHTTTEEIAQALPGTWPADVVTKKIGVGSRYFLHELDVERGKTRINMSRHSNDMALVACRHALKMAKVDADQVDGIVHVTCTPDEAYLLVARDRPCEACSSGRTRTPNTCRPAAVGSWPRFWV